MKKHSIYIAEDDLISAQYLKEILEKEGFDIVGIADNAPEAIEEIRDNDVDVVLMDIILKGAMSGTEAALILQQSRPECKVIFLTAYADEEMIEYALESHAVAYLMKPYREKEIIATIKMATQASKHYIADKTHIKLSHDLSYNIERNVLEKFGREIPLTEKKLKLIEILAQNRNIVVSNGQLSIALWNETGHDSSLRSLISRIKSTVGEKFITNANGLGYMIKYGL